MHETLPVDPQTEAPAQETQPQSIDQIIEQIRTANQGLWRKIEILRQQALTAQNDLTVTERTVQSYSRWQFLWRNLRAKLRPTEQAYSSNNPERDQAIQFWESIQGEKQKLNEICLEQYGVPLYAIFSHLETAEKQQEHDKHCQALEARVLDKITLFEWYATQKDLAHTLLTSTIDNIYRPMLEHIATIGWSSDYPQGLQEALNTLTKGRGFEGIATDIAEALDATMKLEKISPEKAMQTTLLTIPTALLRMGITGERQMEVYTYQLREAISAWIIFRYAKIRVIE